MKKYLYYFLTIILIAIVIALGVYAYFNLPYLAKGENKIVYVNNNEQSFRNSYNDKEYIAMSILDDEKLGIEARTDRDYKYFMVFISRLGEEEALKQHEDFIDNGKIEALLDLDLEEGEYDVKIFYGKEFLKDRDIYVNYELETKTNISKTKEETIKFPRTKIYSFNLGKMKLDNEVKRKHLSLLKYSKEELNEYKKILKDIFKSKDELNDYEKAYLISQYVSDKIYYDYDALKSGNIIEGTAYDAYLSEKAVCQGYAALTEVLLRLEGIPARQTIGYGLGGSGIENESWDNVGEGSNHVWNEAFIDGRWIIIDSTWNSRNSYENGEYKKNTNLTGYFDQTLEYFSEKYRIEKRL